ncbi:MAG TPA: hypothetical protein VN231_13830, partial [Allosphingosinicella sp.]|nr:hypothetical protein [Allosphingosinicella sp.]
MSLRTVLMALGSALLASPSASPPEALSTYAIELRSNEGGLDVRGSAVFPPLESDTGSFAILLSPLARDPRWSFRCNGRRLNIPASSNSEEGGDRRWILRLRQTCPAGSVAMIGFRYRLEAGTAAPQLRVAAESGFAGGGGELWYPQRSFAERQRGRIVLDLPAGLAAIATGALQRQDRTGGRQRFLFETSGPAKLAFAYGPYSEARIGSPSPLTILSTGTPEQAADLARNLAPRIDALERAFGPAPFRSLALVEIDFQSRVLGTSEYGMIFSDPSKMRGAFDGPYWAHEFGHQWWGVGIRPVSASPGAALLTEGLSQFGALLALEAVDGAAAAADYRR